MRLNEFKPQLTTEPKCFRRRAQGADASQVYLGGILLEVGLGFGKHVGICHSCGDSRRSKADDDPRPAGSRAALLAWMIAVGHSRVSVPVMHASTTDGSSHAGKLPMAARSRGRFESPSCMWSSRTSSGGAQGR